MVKGRPASGKITPSKNSILATLTKREYAESKRVLRRLRSLPERFSTTRGRRSATVTLSIAVLLRRSA